ncbi:hypothetical protein H5203_21835 [Pseudoalteromonas sp. SG41-1]|uniref:hypothetical protein n=1 Tax=Pseudoalteromonas sp. SG41-1 TaxID=2760979 RepID=UPI001603BD61|nr:hypothetical protein [Pseudoalteromonas sp. SG41-1]MBB1508080.1 hypothetical protein [Pseudoalteromonas sp. SG41-1]
MNYNELQNAINTKINTITDNIEFLEIAKEINTDLFMAENFIAQAEKHIFNEINIDLVKEKYIGDFIDGIYEYGTDNDYTSDNYATMSILTDLAFPSDNDLYSLAAILEQGAIHFYQQATKTIMTLVATDLIVEIDKLITNIDNQGNIVFLNEWRNNINRFLND